MTMTPQPNRSRIICHRADQGTGFLLVHAGGRLIEQDDAGRQRHGAGDLHPPLMTVG